ncbi:hypothetical protein DFR29_105204 [Tahibacter aquaticus]|uniref:p-aminobenzoate N-oxygenase AurF n=1 Tax=Tahibacter aquaticus TaxID=520092 RepID=A0A4R6Z0H4_9GAMM|nr:P-aminobenzoate N-oxygenase AurF [Tahibacter aquaticus]TDR45021.1 hypothetical protein DFR29_105204 [Tahibacter aquaticus]
MHSGLAQHQTLSLLDDASTVRKLEFNLKRNSEQDHTDAIDSAAAQFVYADCRNEYWNPENHSLLWGTPLWDQASAAQRVVLNQLYWVAYYAQIVSAEIATIFLNQVSAAGLYALEDFRLVCDNLDLESRQERAHIHAFKKISETVEFELFGERLFTYPMRSLFDHTMIYADTTAARNFWRRLQIRGFMLMSSSNAFLASQYLLIRGLRTLNGKLIQHQLSRHYLDHADKDNAPIPSRISYYHFMDESFHFNTSRVVGLEVPRSIAAPGAFERWVVNRAVTGCQDDHANASVVVNGIFWYDPSTYATLYKLFRSKVFGMQQGEAVAMLHACFGQESAGLHAALQTHGTAADSYAAFVEPVAWLDAANRDMRHMRRHGAERYLQRNRAALKRFQPA